MNTASLSTFQMYALLKNSKLNKEIKNSVQIEFNNRNLSTDEIDELQTKYDYVVLADKTSRLKPIHKILLIVFSLLIIVQYVNIIFPALAAYLLGKGKIKMHNAYWLYLKIGIVIWCIILIIIFLFWYY